MFGILTTKAPLAKNGIFRIALQTRAITSLAVMMLWGGNFRSKIQFRNSAIND